MTGKPADQVTKEERSRAKIPNFMFLYAGEEKTYVTNALREFDLVLSLEEAARDREAFFSMWPDLEPAYAATAEEIKSTGQVVSAFGRVRHLPDFRSNSMSVKIAALREGINFRVQSAASDLTMLAATLIHREGYEIVGYIHDSVILEVDEAGAERAAVEIKDIMERVTPRTARERFGVEVGVPLVAETEITDKWS
jgi:DNA polymerase-1